MAKPFIIILTLLNLLHEEQTFIFAHEICHIAFDHIFRSEGKDKRLWNIATDSVINALLKQDGLPIVEGGVDIPEAINYDAEEMYNKLLEEKKKQEQQNSQGNQRQQNSQNSQEQQDSQGNQGQQNSQDSQEQQNSQDSQGGQNSQSGQEGTDIGHDTHSLWDKAIEERKREQQEQVEKKGQEQRQTKKKEKKERTDGEEQGEKKKREVEEKSKFAEQGERETFKQNKIERRKQLQELSRELANKSSHEAGDGIQREGKKLSDIGNFSGIEKELDNLKKQKENISRELSLSEEDIQKYFRKLPSKEKLNFIKNFGFYIHNFKEDGNVVSCLYTKEIDEDLGVDEDFIQDHYYSFLREIKRSNKHIWFNWTDDYGSSYFRRIRLQKV